MNYGNPVASFVFRNSFIVVFESGDMMSYTYNASRGEYYWTYAGRLELPA